MAEFPYIATAPDGTQVKVIFCDHDGTTVTVVETGWVRCTACGTMGVEDVVFVGSSARLEPMS